MQLRKMMLATVLTALPLAAHADPITGLYIGAGAGLNIMQNETVKSVGGLATPNTNVQMNLGAAGLGAVGWGFGNGLRAELEFDYRYNGINKVTSPFGVVATSGSEQKYGPMVNVLYDFNNLSPAVVPYLGAGIGYQWASDKVTGGGSATAGALAYQAILGVGFPIASVPGLAITAEYRFMGLAGNRNYSYAGGTTVLDDDYNHSVLIGLRYAFGAAPAPVAAAPMPMADMGAKTFLVFFDWNKSDLTARSEGIVRDAANYSTSTKYVRIDVDGNTDTSGTPAYNQGLSERRARVVAAELVKDGVPQSAISMHAYGDTKLLVSTGPNTREPQNRRVEIVFH
jgi:outer membrane protein OmpA-like peptidoglycan-associated protein/outer membrane protein W